MDRNEKLSEHFSMGELIRSETAERKGIDNIPPDHLIPKLKRLCSEILEPIRLHYKKAFRPNSGYRSSTLNAEIGGSSTSQHCKAEAVDVEIPGVSNYELAVWVKNNLDFDQVILECYRQGVPNSGWVHISLKDEEAANRGIVLTYTNRKYSEGLHA
jgi:zinc D-Ala-D-Ala carboxypeptidase